MLDRVTIDLLGPGPQRRTGVIGYGPNKGDCGLTLEFDGQTLTACESDYFAALCAIRNQLEHGEVRPFCYGASRNVYPSGMARDMGLGLKAYRLSIGQHAQLIDLVDIFDCGPDVEPVTVAEQREFWQAWLVSIGR